MKVRVLLDFIIFFFFFFFCTVCVAQLVERLFVTEKVAESYSVAHPMESCQSGLMNFFAKEANVKIP
jgi:hypothetical protein